MHSRSRRTVLLVAVALVASGCSLGGSSAGPPPASPSPVITPSGDVRSLSAAQPGEGQRRSCDPIGGTRCALPFPNDWFAATDPSTDTGLRVALDSDDMPHNATADPIDVTEQNRNDGFSPGAALLVDLPGLDLTASGVTSIGDLGPSQDPDAPIVIIDATTGDRHPYWAELDANADAASREEPLLLVHPATNWIEGHRYVVGLRDLVSTDGAPIEAGDTFTQLRDGTPATDDDDAAARRPGMEQILSDLARGGVDRSALVLAWDFTVASERSLSERILHMRDDAFSALGDGAPAFTVTEVDDASDGPLLRTVAGTFQVPSYLTGDGGPGSDLDNGGGAADPLPRSNGTIAANFVCTIPRSAIGSDGTASPTRMALYGHGLLGQADQVRLVAPTYAPFTSTTLCATDWIGLSSGDTDNAIRVLRDLSSFRSLPDRMQQGMLNFLFLGRLMKSERGFTTDPAFQDPAGAGLLDHEHLTMLGLSQGGIMGGATTAVAQDWDRAFLGVPGANYALLLNRSVDFDLFGAILTPAYPDAAERQLALQLIQMLWDRSENNGYAQHFTTDPYPGTGPKQMMLFEAFGDHQVTNISTEVLARTMDIPVRSPALAVGRSRDRDPLWDLERLTELPASGGSYLVLWDFGTPAPPAENVPNRVGDDPHGSGATDPRVLEMGARFLDEGRLIDVCDRKPCTTPAS